MPLANTPAALLAAALVAASPAIAAEPRKDSPTPVSERPADAPGETVPAVGDGSPMPPAFHAPGPDVGMRDPAPVRRSPVWIPPGLTDRSKVNVVSPN